MRRSFLIPTVVLASAFVLSCDHPGPSEPANTPQPSYRTEQNPEGPGAFVVHGPIAAFVAFAPEFTPIIGSTYDEFLHLCATGEPPVHADFLAVFRPHGTPELPDLHFLQHGAQLPLLVFEVPTPPEEELCGLVGTPHLTGTGHYNLTDNDVATTGTRANAASGAIRGEVTSETGERFRLSWTFHALVLPSGELVRFNIEAQLDPIGP